MLERVSSPYLDYHIKIGGFVLISVHIVVNANQFPNLAKCLLIQKLDRFTVKVVYMTGQ